jgi:hypothetical protein
MRVRYPNGKLCKCGCGQSVKERFTPSGKNIGYQKYVEGHQPSPSLCDPAIQAKARISRYPQPTVRFCKCGCGQLARKNIATDGRNRGWYQYAEGHQPPSALLDPANRPPAKYPNGKPCKCGCGQLAKKSIGPDGRNWGWYKYAEGHQPPPPLCDPAILAKAHINHGRRLPVGSRRIREIYGKQYWEIKVAGQRRWQLEHRVIMGRRLGRKLERHEHVHHRDGNGLNNGLHADGGYNGILLSASAHGTLTNKDRPTTLCRCKCPHCGARLTHFKRLGKRPKSRHEHDHPSLKPFTPQPAT